MRSSISESSLMKAIFRYGLCSARLRAVAVVALCLAAGKAAPLLADDGLPIDLRGAAGTAVTASSYYSEGEGSGA